MAGTFHNQLPAAALEQKRVQERDQAIAEFQHRQIDLAETWARMARDELRGRH